MWSQSPFPADEDGQSRTEFVSETTPIIFAIFAKFGSSRPIDDPTLREKVSPASAGDFLFKPLLGVPPDDRSEPWF